MKRFLFFCFVTLVTVLMLSPPAHAGPSFAPDVGTVFQIDMPDIVLHATNDLAINQDQLMFYSRDWIISSDMLTFSEPVIFIRECDAFGDVLKPSCYLTNKYHPPALNGYMVIQQNSFYKYNHITRDKDLLIALRFY